MVLLLSKVFLEGGVCISRIFLELFPIFYTQICGSILPKCDAQQQQKK